MYLDKDLIDRTLKAITIFHQERLGTIPYDVFPYSPDKYTIESVHSGPDSMTITVGTDTGHLYKTIHRKTDDYISIVCFERIDEGSINLETDVYIRSFD